MGSIFKPSTTVVQAPSSSSTSYDIPEYFKEIQERTLRRAENVFDVPYQAFTGDRIADLDPMETQAANIYKNQILPQSLTARVPGKVPNPIEQPPKFCGNLISLKMTFQPKG